MANLAGQKLYEFNTENMLRRNKKRRQPGVINRPVVPSSATENVSDDFYKPVEPVAIGTPEQTGRRNVVPSSATENVSDDFYKPVEPVAIGTPEQTGRRSVVPSSTRVAALSPTASTEERILKLKELGYYDEPAVAPDTITEPAEGAMQTVTPTGVTPTGVTPTGVTPTREDKFQQFRERVAFSRLSPQKQRAEIAKQRQMESHYAQMAELQRRTDIKAAEAKRKADIEERRVAATERTGEIAERREERAEQLFPEELEQKKLATEEAKRGRRVAIEAEPYEERRMVAATEKAEAEAEQEKYETEDKAQKLLITQTGGLTEAERNKRWREHEEKKRELRQKARDRFDAQFDRPSQGLTLDPDRLIELTEELLLRTPGEEQTEVRQKTARRIDREIKDIDNSIERQKKLLETAPDKSDDTEISTKSEIQLDISAFENEKEGLLSAKKDIISGSKVIKPIPATRPTETQPAEARRVLTQSGIDLLPEGTRYIGADEKYHIKPIPATRPTETQPAEARRVLTQSEIDLLPDGSLYTGADGKVYMKAVPGKTKEQVFAERGIR